MMRSERIAQWSAQRRTLGEGALILRKMYSHISTTSPVLAQIYWRNCSRQHVFASTTECLKDKAPTSPDGAWPGGHDCMCTLRFLKHSLDIVHTDPRSATLPALI